MTTVQEKPATTFFSRIWTYLVEMYPLHVNVPYSFMSFFGFHMLVQALHGVHPLAVSRASVAGAFTLAAFTLLMRVFDEFKDYEHDCRLFPHRPLPSGRVRPGDLRLLGWTLVIFMTALNVTLGKGFLGFLALLTFALLMFRYFFLPDLHRRSLLLTLVTHNPVVFFTHLYVLSVFMQEQGLSFRALAPATWPGIAMFWLLVFSWETSRKIRAREEEDAYVTYSQIFGPRRAALVPVVGLTISAAIAVMFHRMLGLSWPFLVAVGLAYFYAMSGFVRWLRVQSPANSKLRPFVEAFSLVLYLAVILDLGIRIGFRWMPL